MEPRIVLRGHVPLTGDFLQDSALGVKLAPIFADFVEALTEACPDATFEHEHSANAPKRGRKPKAPAA